MSRERERKERKANEEYNRLAYVCHGNGLISSEYRQPIFLGAPSGLEQNGSNEDALAES